MRAASPGSCGLLAAKHGHVARRPLRTWRPDRIPGPRPDRSSPEIVVFSQLSARLEGLEPPTGCLEGRFMQGVNLPVPRSEVMPGPRG